MGMAGGGIKPWLPLMVAAVVMPVLAYLTTTFVLVPKLEKALGKSDANASAAAEAGDKTGEKSGEKTGEKTAAKTKHGGAPAASAKKFNQPSVVNAEPIGVNGKRSSSPCKWTFKRSAIFAASAAKKGSVGRQILHATRAYASVRTRPRGCTFRAGQRLRVFHA